MKEHLSDRTRSLPASDIVKMEEMASDLCEKGIHIINMNCGAPILLPPRKTYQAAHEAIDSGKYFDYPPMGGYYDLRKVIAHKFWKENNIPCTPENVMVSNGAKQSLSNLFATLFNPLDEVIVFTPYWASYVPMLRLYGAIPVEISGPAENGFKPTPGQLASAITSRTRAVLFSSPCNPAGFVMSEHELMDIAKVLKSHPEIIVIADEIYEYINFTDKHTSIGSLPDMQGRVATVNGISKGFSMMGWRIGYMASPEWLTKACIRFQSQTTGASSSIAQRAALAAISGGRDLVRDIVSHYKRDRDICVSWWENFSGQSVFVPEGAFFLLLNVKSYFGKVGRGKKIENTHDLCMYLLEEAHVATVSGASFGVPDHIRVSFTVEEHELEVALQRMGSAFLKLDN